VTDFCVIGSGPSAVAAAVALTQRGLGVTMVDAGHSLEDSRRSVVDRMASQKPEEWEASDLAKLKEGVEASASGIPLKRLYGSKFPFADEGTGFTLRESLVGARPSFARGGLSNVWGAGMLPFHSEDIADWPFDAEDLEPGYRAVLGFIPHQPIQPSRQGAEFLRDAERSREALARDGITVSQAQLAVDGSRCERCGLCLYGCPYGLIYNSLSTVRELQVLPKFRYEPGFVVERLVEEDSHVRVVGQGREMLAARVLLGAGVIPSTAILLGSLGDFSVPVRALDSLYFLFPLLRFQAVSHLEQEQLHTLAQAFILMRDPDVCDSLVHFSVYGYNDLMVPSLVAASGVAGKLLASRMLVCGGYLHSRISPGFEIAVTPGADGRGYRVLLEGESLASARATARKAVWRLMRQSYRLGAVALAPAIRFGQPGRGFHSGGTFPMHRERVRHTSDIEGRPFGFERVHLVDSSCLPSIPATTITLPVMANAWRIANLAADRA